MKQKYKYVTYWKEITKTQNKLNCYLPLNRLYTMTDDLTVVTDSKQQTWPMHRFSEHRLYAGGFVYLC